MQSINPEQYQTQLDHKISLVKKALSPIAPPEPEVFPSEPLHYRMRAEFRIWHEKDQCYHIMFEQGSKKIKRIDEFPAGSKRINQLMQQLMVEVNDNETLKKKLFQVDYLTGKSNDAIISLLYHKKLDSHWQDHANKLSERLGIHIIGRARKQKWTTGQDYIKETLNVAGKQWYYRQVENAFSQPNAGINEQMLSWVHKITHNSQHDLLELYCGNANFTCVLANNFRQVLATEISKSAVEAAQHNLASNGITNTDIVRMSSEEFTQAMDEVRPFRRLQNIDLKSYQFGTLLVDPPRAGLDDKTLKLASRFNRIIYISCNPQTLAANAAALLETHNTVSQFAIFDQFPYTEHTECALVFENNTTI